MFSVKQSSEWRRVRVVHALRIHAQLPDLKKRTREHQAAVEEV